jgi:hypothetical protein
VVTALRGEHASPTPHGGVDSSGIGDYWIETYVGIVLAIMEREKERQRDRGPAT